MDEAILEIKRNMIKHKAEKLIEIINEKFLVSGNYYIAGNSLNKKQYSDIDIFPIPAGNVCASDSFIVSKTKNATTYNNNGCILQICNYIRDNLKDLVDSFDFSHIQVGAKVVDSKVIEVYFSNNYLNAKILEDSKFIGSEYPLSSLVRAGKYLKKQEISKGQYIFSVINILVDIKKRGFLDYADFKDQLDAVDLGLVPKDLKEIGDSKFMELFELLKK